MVMFPWPSELIAHPPTVNSRDLLHGISLFAQLDYDTNTGVIFETDIDITSVFCL